MQPYFFPNMAHFALIARTDRWVIFDVTQYTPKSWMSRNRVLHPDTGWNYINVALVNSSISILTREARVLDPEKVRSSVLGKLSHYQRKAPHYAAVISLVNHVFDGLRDNSLVHLNARTLDAVCRYIELPFDCSICSELGLDLTGIERPGAWAPEISHQLGASQYINPVGGRALFDPSDFEQRGVALGFLEFSEFCYDTGRYGFEQGLSILDVLMWNAPQEVRQGLFEHSRVIDADPAG